MGSILVAMLFAAALAIALGTIFATVVPEFRRIRSLLLTGGMPAEALVPLPARRAGVRPSPRLTASPVHLRAAA